MVEHQLPKLTMGVRFPSGAPKKMKKGKLFILGSLLVSSLALSGCIFDYFFPSDEDDTEIKAPSIDVVSSLKLNLQGKAQKTLYPTLSDSAVKNPVFEYASSNAGVATVNSSGVVTGVSVGKCNITVTLQSNKSIKTTVAVEVVNEEAEHYDYTIMLYMCGSDLEFYSSKTKDDEQWFFTRDIQEILSVQNIPDSVKIIIETGGTVKWGMPSSYLEGTDEISSIKLQRWEVNNETHKLQLVDTLNTNYMAKEDSFENFLSWGLDDYEADQMGVIISGHGGGIAGCAYDDNYTYKYGQDYYQHTLQTFEVANAAKAALSNSEKDKFTWIGYDCCLMQCADIATVNSDYFEYMVASQELEDAIGWNHDEYLPYLASNPSITPSEFLPKICDSFLSDKHRNNESQACLQTLSVLDLSKVDSVISSFEAIVPQLGSTSTAYSRAKTAFEASYNNFGEGMYGLCDFNSLLKQIQSKYSISTTAAQSAIDELVLYTKNCTRYSSANTPCGVNAFFPDYVASDDRYALQVGREDYENKNSTKFSKWQTLCLSGDDFGW